MKYRKIAAVLGGLALTYGLIQGSEYLVTRNTFPPPQTSATQSAAYSPTKIETQIGRLRAQRILDVNDTLAERVIFSGKRMAAKEFLHKHE